MPLQLNKLGMVVLLLISSVANADETTTIGNFSQKDLSGWESQEFKGQTNYSLVELNNTTALKATSHNSASGLVKKKRIDLHRTPYLNWQWQIDKSMYRLAEDFKQGDDFVARVYVIIDGGVFFWRTLALNYVWASGKTPGSLWDNPFTSNAKMLAVESGDAKAGHWLTEKRNVREDLKKAFDQDFRFIDAVAIMTDSDNAGQKATAYYGDIYFSAE